MKHHTTFVADLRRTRNPVALAQYYRTPFILWDSDHTHTHTPPPPTHSRISVQHILMAPSVKQPASRTKCRVGGHIHTITRQLGYSKPRRKTLSGIYCSTVLAQREISWIIATWRRHHHGDMEQLPATLYSLKLQDYDINLTPKPKPPRDQ